MTKVMQTDEERESLAWWFSYNIAHAGNLVPKKPGGKLGHKELVRYVNGWSDIAVAKAATEALGREVTKNHVVAVRLAEFGQERNSPEPKEEPVDGPPETVDEISEPVEAADRGDLDDGAWRASVEAELAGLRAEIESMKRFLPAQARLSLIEGKR